MNMDSSKEWILKNRRYKHKKSLLRQCSTEMMIQAGVYRICFCINFLQQNSLALFHIHLYLKILQKVQCRHTLITVL